MYRIAFAAVITCALATESRAGDCSAGDAPTSHSSLTCDGGGANDICSLQAANTRINCGLGLNGNSYNANAKAVANYNASTYSVWGTNAANAPFCCSFAAGSVNSVEVHGGAHNDVLSFTFTESSVQYDLEPAGATPVVAEMVGEDGNDTMAGSNATVDYSETLRGQSGDDVIRGNAGEDVCNGGDDDDRIDGGPDIDTLLGGPGMDVLCDRDDDDLQGGTDEDDLWLPGTSSGSLDGGDPGTNSCGNKFGGSLTFIQCPVLDRTSTPPMCP